MSNAAVRAWRHPASARRLLERVGAVAGHGGLFHVGAALVALAATVPEESGTAT